MSNIIIGAGMTGLAAGLKTGWPIYEAGSAPGGLCRSYRKAGFQFDVGGGHWMFGDLEIRERISQYSEVPLVDYDRRAAVYLEQTYPYPIQGFLGAEESYYPSSLKGWLLNKFGDAACRFFFWPFNKKYTGGMMDEIIQDDPGKSPIQGSGYNAEFSYPASGWDVVADNLANGQKIHYRKRLAMLEPKMHRAHFDDGSSVYYDKLISTIPLTVLMGVCGRYVFDLPHTSVWVWNIGARATHRTPKDQWYYIPGDNAPFYRVGFYSNVEPLLAPERCVSVYVESVKDCKTDDVVEWLKERGWIGEVIVENKEYIPYAYTWCNHNTDRDKYLNELKEHGIISIGRYGKWKFQGIAESFKDGLMVEM